MKLLFIIVLLAIFSTTDAYGFLNKKKSKNVAKNKKTSSLKTSVAAELNQETPQKTISKPEVKSSLTDKAVPSTNAKKEASNVKKSTVDKLQIIEQQHYHGNRELLIKHLQRQIELKKQQSINQQSGNTESKIVQQSQQESSPEYSHHSTITDSRNMHQDVPQQQNIQVKRSPSSQRRNLQQHRPISQQPSQVRQMQHNQQSIPQQAQISKDVQHISLQQNTIHVPQQQQQMQTHQTMQHIPQHQQQSSMLMQQQNNQQHLLSHQGIQQSQQAGLFEQQHINQQQNTIQHIQPQPVNSITQDVSHIEQSFLPQQDLMHIQNQFKNRNNVHNVQPQMQIQPVDMHEPVNILQNGNTAYQSQSHAQLLVQQPQVRIQTLHHQPSNNVVNQLQLQQHNTNQAQMQSQHILMPLNSISMDSLLRPKAMQPERFIIVKNNNLPEPITTPKPTTTTPKPTTTTTTTPQPTTTKPTTTPSEPGRDVKRETQRPSLRQKFFEKEMRKQDLEITKLELEIRALKRVEKLGILPKELELEAARRKASATNTPAPTTTTMLPFLDFGKNKLKFPFDF